MAAHMIEDHQNESAFILLCIKQTRIEPICLSIEGRYLLQYCASGPFIPKEPISPISGENRYTLQQRYGSPSRGPLIPRLWVSTWSSFDDIKHCFGP